MWKSNDTNDAEWVKSQLEQIQEGGGGEAILKALFDFKAFPLNVATCSLGY